MNGTKQIKESLLSAVTTIQMKENELNLPDAYVKVSIVYTRKCFN